MIDRAKFRTGLLTFLILLSIVLSALLWTTGGPLINMEERDGKQDPKINQTVPSITDRGLEEFYKPIQLITHKAGGQGVSQAITDSKMQKEIFDLLERSELDGFLNTQEMSRFDYANLTQSSNWLEIIYDDVVPAGIFKERFSSLSKDWNEYMFDRALIDLNRQNSIWLYNYTDERTARVQITKFEFSTFEQLIAESEEDSVPVFAATLKGNSVYLPVNDQEMPRKSYLIEKLPNSIYVSYFFPDTSIVDARTTKNITRYIDLTQELSINQETNVLTYLSQANVSGNMSITDRFVTSYEFINNLDNWQEQVVYHAYNEKDHRVSYLRYIGSYPVLNHPKMDSTIQISVEDGKLVYLQLPMRFVQTPITLQKKESEQLANGFTVLEKLRANGVVVTEEIESLVIGYSWKEREENTKVVDLIPTWFIYADNEWLSLDNYLTKRAGGELTYEF